ncbi:CBS domain-containing protein [Candidatus Bathyarchaeota archaeon]|nr:MAG: CBS domain-containing protein [Candidatus Bathyarchaeota archaeon]
MGILNINSVEDAMVTVVTMGSEGSLAKAIKLMNAGDLECIVITEGGDPMGILTKRDIIRLVAQDADIDRVPVKDVMTRPLITIEHDATVEGLLRLMEEKKIHHLPVMKGGKLVGIVDSQRIRSLGLLDALSIFTISAHAHYTPYLYAKMSQVYDVLAERLEGVTDIPEIIRIVSDELRERELVDEITMEQVDDEIVLTVKDCMYSKSVHPFIEGEKELCVMGLLASMSIQKATGKRVNFVNFCDITETGSKTRIIMR